MISAKRDEFTKLRLGEPSKESISLDFWSYNTEGNITEDGEIKGYHRGEVVPDDLIEKIQPFADEFKKLVTDFDLSISKIMSAMYPILAKYWNKEEFESEREHKRFEEAARIEKQHKETFERVKQYLTDDSLPPVPTK